MPVEDMVEKVCRMMAKSPRMRFRSVFRAEDSRPEMIATFLAILEMIKLSKIRAEYSEGEHDFVLVGA